MTHYISNNKANYGDIFREEECMRESSEKHRKFREIAEGRTNKAIDAIARLGNLSNRSLYVWEESEVKRIIKALRDSVAEVDNRFASPKGKSNAEFKL